MKISKGSFLHEVLILVLYIFLSPILFGGFYPEAISGDSGLLYIAILMITGLTTIISLILIYVYKKIIEITVMDCFVGFIPLIISFLIYKRMFSNSHDDAYYLTFLKSNMIDIVICYGISTIHKIREHLGID